MNDIVQVANPISGEVAARPSGGGVMANTDQQRAVAEVQAAMIIARSNPRDQIVAMDRILNACQRQRLAEAAVYSYARGGTDITGPSIRLAEAIAQQWGNIQFGIREIEQRKGESVVQAFAWDVETNVRREMTFAVPHIRHTKQGQKPLIDPRDIYEMVANNGARRLRSCILAVIPSDVVDAAVEQCEATMRAKADTSPEALLAMVNAFQQFGVVQQQIEERIQRRLDAIQPAQIVALKKIYASLRDGMSSPSDWFEPIEDDQDGSVKESARKGNAGARAALKEAAAASQSETGPGDEPQRPSKGKGAEADHFGPEPGNPKHGESWYSTADKKLRYAHHTPEGIKWYVSEPKPLEDEGSDTSQAEVAAQTVEDIDGELEQGSDEQDAVDRPMEQWAKDEQRIVDLINLAQTRADLSMADSEFLKVSASLPDSIRNGLEARLNAARKDIQAREG